MYIILHYIKNRKTHIVIHTYISMVRTGVGGCERVWTGADECRWVRCGETTLEDKKKRENKTRMSVQCMVFMHV